MGKDMVREEDGMNRLNEIRNLEPAKPVEMPNGWSSQALSMDEAMRVLPHLPYLLSLIDRARDILADEDVEYGSWDVLSSESACPVCGEFGPDGRISGSRGLHAPDCELGAWLEETKPGEEAGDIDER